MATPKSDDCYSPEEAARRRDEALKRALNTPPTPHRPKLQPKKVKRPSDDRPKAD